MSELTTIRAFALRFVLTFIVLVLPWPPFQRSLTSLFQSEMRFLLGVAFPRALLRVEPYRDPQHSSIDTKISLEDVRDVRPDGQVPVKLITLDSRSVCWTPHAFWLALFAATPGVWRKKVKGFLTGTGLVQFFVATTIVMTALSAMPDPSPAWRVYLVAALNHLLLDNLWLSFVAPLIFWIVSLSWHGSLQAFLSTQEKQRISK